MSSLFRRLVGDLPRKDVDNNNNDNNDEKDVLDGAVKENDIENKHDRLINVKVNNDNNDIDTDNINDGRNSGNENNNNNNNNNNIEVNAETPDLIRSSTWTPDQGGVDVGENQATSQLKILGLEENGTVDVGRSVCGSKMI